MRLRVLVLCLSGLLAAPGRSAESSLETMDPGREWRLRALVIEGTDDVPARALAAVMATRERPWFAVWRAWPLFDPTAFRTDLERIAAVHRSRGYHHARVTPRVDADDATGLVRATIHVDEGPAVRVTSVRVAVETPPGDVPAPATLEAALPLRPTGVFTEDGYDQGRQALLAAYRDRGYARATVAKHAVVDVGANDARVTYTVDPGPSAVFGDVEIEGLQAVDAEVVRREIAWGRDAPFDQRLIARTRKSLLALRLFRSVRIDEDPSRDPRVRTTIVVEETPPREIRLGIGYDTEEQARGLAVWRNYDFLGGARQLGFTARVSALRRTLGADFLQPHWPIPNSRTRLVFVQEQQDEDTYTLDLTRLLPRFEWSLTPNLGVYGYYRVELDLLSGVPDAVERALPNAHPSQTVLSGLAFGLDWNATDDLTDPSRGWITSLVVEPVGGALGGDVSFVRAVAEGRAFVPLPWSVTFATRVRAGGAEPYGDTVVVPLWERFYPGGINSVRGYARRRVGPLVADDPVGGQSLLESSFELRRPITETIGLAVFIDGGQAWAEPFRWDPGDLRWGAGSGVRLKTPVGPIRVDLGFPFDRRGDDGAWQIYFSVGQTF